VFISMVEQFPAFLFMYIPFNLQEP
jgi:hypothetical protein